MYTTSIGVNEQTSDKILIKLAQSLTYMQGLDDPVTSHMGFLPYVEEFHVQYPKINWDKTVLIA